MSIAYFSPYGAPSPYSTSPVYVEQNGGSMRRNELIYHPQLGYGWFDDAWSFIKAAAPVVHKFVKDNKIISKVIAPLATKIPVIGPTVGGVGGFVADQLGYGYMPPPCMKT